MLSGTRVVGRFIQLSKCTSPIPDNPSINPNITAAILECPDFTIHKNRLTKASDTFIAKYKKSITTTPAHIATIKIKVSTQRAAFAWRVVHSQSYS